MSPSDWMEKVKETQVAIAPKFGLTQQAVSMKLAGERPWKTSEAAIWEEISGGEVTRDEVLFPERYTKAS